MKKFAGAGPLRANAARDWLLLLCGSIVLFAISVVWNAWFLNHIVDEGIETGNVGSETLDAYEASSVNEVFDTRAVNAEAYRTTYPFVDPSR